MTEHRNWALATLLAFLALTAWSILDSRRGRRPGALFVGILLAAGLLLVSTAWHGGELVYRYGPGVMSLPQAEGEDHDHEHADGKMHAPAGAAPVPPQQSASDMQPEHAGAAPVAESVAPVAEPAPPKPRAKSRKPHNADGHTHEHKN